MTTESQIEDENLLIPPDHCPQCGGYDCVHYEAARVPEWMDDERAEEFAATAEPILVCSRCGLVEE